MKRGLRLEACEKAKSRLGSRSGIGLAEVLVSLFVFSTALLGIVGTSARVGMTVNSSHARVRALTVARQQLEGLMSAEFSEVKSGATNRDGLTMSWVVQETRYAKSISLVYGYDLPSGARQDTITAALIKP